MDQPFENQEREPLEADRPIHTAEQDRFGRWQFSKRIAEVIVERRDTSSVVVAIYAPWGDGKTSVLNMITTELETHAEKIILVRFNPWRFQSETHLLKNFFETVAETLGKSLTTRGENVSKFFRDYADVLAPISLLGVDAAKAVKGVSEVIPEADLEKLKARIEQALTESNQRVVIIMDDIDRLDKNEIQAVFKLVKLSADFPNTAYILAFDEEMVAHALGEKYGSLEAGRNYVEKIVQVPLHLPPAHEYALRSITFEGVEAAVKLAGLDPSEEQAQRFVNTFVRSFQSHLKTPRLAKRYVNGLTFALPLVKNEVDPIDFMIVEGIRVFMPSLYYAIRNHGDVFLGKHLDQNRKSGAEQIRKIVESAIKDLTEREKVTAKHVIRELFPRMGGADILGGSIYGSEWQSHWSQQKRIAALDYFDRYFSYGVPPNDFSDRQVEEFLKQIETQDVAFVVREIRSLATAERAAVFVGKLRVRENEVPPIVASRLAQGVALCGDVFPNTGGVLGDFGASTAAQACILIRHLIQRLPSQAERDTLALQIADQTTDLMFAVLYLRWVRTIKSTDKSQPDDAIISNECEVEISGRIAKRFAAEAAEGLLTKKYGKNAGKLYQSWSWIDNEGLRQHLANRMSQFPAEAPELLRQFMRTAWSLETGISFEMDLDRKNYDFISSIIDPEILMTAIRKVYPTIDDPKQEFKDRKSVSKEDRAAAAFALLHQQVQQDRNETRESDGDTPT
jgi:hypothetical protein